MSPQRKVDVLVEEIKRSIRKKTATKVEIRTEVGPGWATARRLMRSLQAGGLRAEVVEVENSPHREMLLEAGRDQAEVALSLQSAFRASGIQAGLIVHQN